MLAMLQPHGIPFISRENHVAFKTQSFSTNHWVRLPFLAVSAQPQLDTTHSRLQFHCNKLFSPLMTTKNCRQFTEN